MKKQSFIITFIALILFSSCSKQFIGDGITNSPVNNFETICEPR